MFTNKDVIEIELENIKYSAITFSDKNCELPSFLLQGEKKPGYIYKNGELENWYWKGFTTYKDKKCLYFDPIKLYPLSELSFSLRSKAPLLISNLAKALSKLDSSFLDLQSGIVSAWRIYFTDDDSVLILPRNLSDIFSSTSNEKIRYDNANFFIHAGILPSFTLIDQMVQLYYYSITSIRPFEFTTVRENHYDAIKLQVLIKALEIDVDSDLIDKLDKILHLKLSKIRDISANYEPQIALKWFIERFDNVKWDLENRDYFKLEVEDLSKNPKLETTITKYQKKEKRLVFWRKRGTIIIVSTIIAAFLIAFIVGRVQEALAPPYTAEFNKNEIINAYYESQNNLDVQKLEASLKRGTKSPVANEITTLFVTRQTRMAYEQVDTVVNPTTWVEENMPPIDSKNLIYDIDDVQISQINENQFLVESIYYSPYPLENEEVEQENTTPTELYTCYRFKQTEVFNFEYNDRGWFEISNIQNTSMQYIDTLLVPTFNSFDKSYDITKDERKTKSIIEEKYLNAIYE